MKRVFVGLGAVALVVVLGLGVARAAHASVPSQIAAFVTGYSRPAGEYPLLLQLNGEPGTVFVSEAGRDGGTVGISNVTGGIIKTQCTAAACICPGSTCVCPGASLASNFSTTVGEKLAADGVHYMVLKPATTQISVIAVSGSTRVDGGAGADCFHWPMQ